MEPVGQFTDSDAMCFEKARAKGEPTFTLRAQDITAPLFVLLWADTLRWLCEQNVRGIPIEESIEILRRRFFAVFPDLSGLPIGARMNNKISTAMGIAEAMDRATITKRMAD